MASPITDYAQNLRMLLAFDPSLARRTADEAEAHLSEATMDDDSEPNVRAAIDRFGDAPTIAAQVADAALPRRVRQTWLYFAATALVVLVTMRLRGELLAEAGSSGPLLLAVWVDRLSFCLALLAGALAFLTGDARVNVPSAHRMGNALRLSLLALALSVAAGILLLPAGLMVASGPVAFVLIGAGLIETSAVVLGAAHLRRLRRNALAASLG